MSDRNAATTLGKQIGTLFDLGALGTMPDRSLLDQFARGGEPSEAAFATLVERHGPMVLRVCRHVLADGHLAEDAFQVTFLLLARRARSIHDPDALAGWLHRVARRVALRARAGIHGHNDREGPKTVCVDVAVSEADPVERDELCAVIHEEIDRLVDAQRLPILLCALEGLSHEEAASRLGWQLGTVKSRLVRGRRRLHSRLTRRGLAPALALVAGDAGRSKAAAHVPLVLAMATTRAALHSSAGATAAAAPVSASIALLLQRELSFLLIAKIRLAAGAAVAGAAAILIGVTLAGPTLGHSQGIAGVDDKAPASEGIAQNVARPVRMVAHAIGGSTPADRSAIQDVDQGNRAVIVPDRRLSPLGKQVEPAIRQGIEFLKAQQRPNGSWADFDNEARTGVTSMVTLALLSAGETPDSQAIKGALEYLRRFGPRDLRSTYAISLQTMVYAAADPAKDEVRIRANVEWLEEAQIKSGDPQFWPGSWSYSALNRGRPGDNSNTQYALLGLHAASEIGIPVKQTAWELARNYWERSQKRDGSWAYTPDAQNPTASMTCAGVSSLIISGVKRFPNGEFVQGAWIARCGPGGPDRNVERGIDWLASNFQVGQNFGAGHQWQFYYLYGLERAGRLAGLRFFGEHDWYRMGAEELIQQHEKASGFFQGALVESDKVLATSFALLFLCKGRAPVLINKLRHGPTGDWDNDHDDVRNLVGIVSRDWKHLLTWQTVDPKKATVADLLRAPILFINGHKAPELAPAERQLLRAYVDGGGVILGEACCGSADFDRGFGSLMAEMFPGKEEGLRRLPDDHPIWRSRHRLTPAMHPMFGIPRGFRTAVIYSPKDLSCYWNQAERGRADPAVIEAIRVGQNVIDYVTGRELPPDKLSDR
jgi:RNA polymerase sigma factor (sigma-70 family)